MVGPARQWMQVGASIRRVNRAVKLARPDTAPIDTEDVRPELILGAGAEALLDLRTRVLAPLVELSPQVADRLTETLRSWLLHHGRRDDIAADLFVSPSTVRYRLRQLRELYGEQLQQPRAILELTMALAADPPATPVDTTAAD